MGHHTQVPRLVAAPDKFRGSASAHQAAAAIAEAATGAGWVADVAPMSDGGEGILDVLGGAARETRVQGPLGEAVVAEWRMLDPSTALIEMARASGLDLVGGAEWNDPLRASTVGVGQLVMAAVAAGAKQVIVGVGGSATTDGGQGCLEALEPRARLAGITLLVACDVETRFVDAARVFAPQKGASEAQVALLTRRLEALADRYLSEHGVDVREMPGSGAAGGLAGGLAAVGAELLPGFDLVADRVDLAERIEGAALVVTGEGLVDEQSFAGKTVGGVVDLAGEAGVPVLVVAGDVVDDLGPLPAGVEVVSLIERFGEERAWNDVGGCIAEAVSERLAGGTVTV